MTVPPPVRSAGPADPLTVLRGSDRVLAPLAPARAALARLDRLRRPSGPVLRHGAEAAFLLAPGSAELVPELLGWLGWGEELRLPIEAAGPARVPRPRTGRSPRSAVWLRTGEDRPALDLRSPDLLRLLDCLADACARELLGLPPAR